MLSCNFDWTVLTVTKTDLLVSRSLTSTDFDFDLIDSPNRIILALIRYITHHTTKRLPFVLG